MIRIRLGKKGYGRSWGIPGTIPADFGKGRNKKKRLIGFRAPFFSEAKRVQIVERWYKKLFNESEIDTRIAMNCAAHEYAFYCVGRTLLWIARIVMIGIAIYALFQYLVK